MRYIRQIFASISSKPISPVEQLEFSGPHQDLPLHDRRISPEALSHYRDLIACLPLPVCLIDHKGFIQFMNEEFLTIAPIPISTDECPFLGRFLSNESSDEFRRALDALGESQGKWTMAFNFALLSSYLSDEPPYLNFLWTVSGGKSSSVYLVCAR